jgi:hypothetical protein
MDLVKTFIFIDINSFIKNHMNITIKQIQKYLFRKIIYY